MLVRVLEWLGIACVYHGRLLFTCTYRRSTIVHCVPVHRYHQPRDLLWFMCSSVLRAHTVRKQHEAATCLHVRVNTVLEPSHMFVHAHALPLYFCVCVLLPPASYSYTFHDVCGAPVRARGQPRELTRLHHDVDFRMWRTFHE